MALIQPTRLETQRCLFGFGDVVNLMISEIKRRPFDLATHIVSLIWSRLVSMNFGTCLESPCLMFSQNSSTSWKIFHSGYNDLYIFDFPELEGAEIHFSKDGWLLMGVDECPLFFFNPSMRAKFVLPPTPCSFISVCFTSPPTSSSCCVFGLLSDSTGFEFCYGVIKFGDDEWRLGRWETIHFFAISNCPPLFCNGVYYLLDSLSTSIIEYDPAKEDENAWKHSFLVHINQNVDNEEEGDTSSLINRRLSNFFMNAKVFSSPSISKPPTYPDCHVLFLPITYSDDPILYCRLGDEKFIKRSKNIGDNHFLASINFEGKIYGWMNDSCKIVEVDFVEDDIVINELVNITGQPLMIPFPAPSTTGVFESYMVDCCGELLVVFMICYRHSADTAYFRIFKINVLDREVSELKSIGDRIIFLSPQDCTSKLCGPGESNLKRNSINYISRDNYLHVYDIEDRSKTLVKLCPIQRRKECVMSWIA